jgi:VWFA-related protein
MRLGKLTLFSFAAIFTLSSLGAGQNPSAPAAPTLHVYSRETIVDVLVTDDKGQPVTGLKQSDFTVLEDGQPQPIRGFNEYDKASPPSPARTLPPGTYTNSTTLPASGPVQIFLFDLLGTGPAVMERAKKYIADYLRSMPQGTQVAVFEFSPSKGLVLLHDFTTDGPAAADVVDKLNVEWLRNPGVGEPIAIAGFNQIADYVAGIHGRKNLIWIIPAIPRNLLIARDGGYMDPCPTLIPPDMTYVHRLMDIYDIFTKEQIAVYPFDPRGVHEPGCIQLRSEEVAEGTGGATGNSNDYQSTIAEIVDKTSHMYTLSYVPTRPDEDGHFHPIKITVNRPSLHLNYRPGYNDEQPLPPDAILKQQMIQGPMRLGAIPATQILFDLHVQPATSSPTQLTLQPANSTASGTEPPHTKGAPYDTVFTLDPTQIALTETPDGIRTANIELDLGAFDFYGKLVATRSQTFKITVTPAQYNGFFRTPLKFSLPIDLPRGQLTLRAGVFDTAANKAGTLEIPLTVPKNPASR